jgi:hypothetical protein
MHRAFKNYFLKHRYFGTVITQRDGHSAFHFTSIDLDNIFKKAHSLYAQIGASVCVLGVK